MIEYKDEDADKRDGDLWVVDRSGLGLDLIKRKHFSFTHTQGKVEEEINICRQLLAVVCKADQQSLLFASNARAHSLSVAYHNEHFCWVFTEISCLKTC
jgi:hypothetical protein